jgi:hypothetical protein
MNIKIKPYLIRYSGTFFSILLSILLVIILKYFVLQTLSILAKIVILCIFAITSYKIGQYISNVILKKYIYHSDNPRKTFWKIYRMELLNHAIIKEIPPVTYLKTDFDDKYVFYNSWSAKKLQILINNNIFRVQDEIGKFWVFKIDDINNFRINPKIIDKGDGWDYIVNLDILLKNNQKESYDIRYIVCDIDELEQILEHFIKLNKKTSYN